MTENIEVFTHSIIRNKSACPPYRKFRGGETYNFKKRRGKSENLALDPQLFMLLRNRKRRIQRGEKRRICLKF